MENDRNMIKGKPFSKEKDKNILLSCCYWLPNDDSENLTTFLQNNIIEKFVSEKKINHMIGDFNMNCLKYQENKKKNTFTITFLKKVPFLS